MVTVLFVCAVVLYINRISLLLFPGLHTWQKMYGCELREDGSKRGYDQYSYDGRDFLNFDKETLTWTAIDREAQLIKRAWEADLDRLQRNKLFLEEICIGLLLKFLEYGKEAFARKGEADVSENKQKGNLVGSLLLERNRQFKSYLIKDYRSIKGTIKNIKKSTFNVTGY